MADSWNSSQRVASYLPYRMKAQTDEHPDAAPLPEGELARLELRVATRADCLWRDSGSTKGSDLIHWLQAENEILGPYLADDRPAEAMAEAQ